MKELSFRLVLTHTMKYWTFFVGATLLLTVFTFPAFSQQQWQKTFGGSASDIGLSVQLTPDGGYIVAGWTMSRGAGNADVYLIKTDSSGDTLWTHTYGGGGSDQGASVQLTPDGGYIIAGYTSSFGAGSNDVYLIKTDASGDTLWTRTFGGVNSDQGSSVQLTPDSGYIIAGYTSSFGAGSSDFYLIKTNPAGNPLWVHTYGGPDEDWCFSVQLTSDGGYILAGATESFGMGGDVYLVKTDSLGGTLWTHTYGGINSDQGFSVQPTPDSGFIVAGYTRSFGAGRSDVYLIKTNASGSSLWTRTFGGVDSDQGSSVQLTPDGGYIVAGYTLSFGVGSNDIYLIKTNSSGDTLWTRTGGGANSDDASSVQLTPDGGYILAGSTSSFGAGRLDVYLVKTEANGIIGLEEKSKKLNQVPFDRLEAKPNPFASFTKVPGYESISFQLYDISGKLVGDCRGDRIGEKLNNGVYFLKAINQIHKTLKLLKL